MSVMLSELVVSTCVTVCRQAPEDGDGAAPERRSEYDTAAKSVRGKMPAAAEVSVVVLESAPYFMHPPRPEDIDPAEWKVLRADFKKTTHDWFDAFFFDTPTMKNVMKYFQLEFDGLGLGSTEDYKVVPAKWTGGASAPPSEIPLTAHFPGKSSAGEPGVRLLCVASSWHRFIFYVCFNTGDIAHFHVINFFVKGLHGDWGLNDVKGAGNGRTAVPTDLAKTVGLEWLKAYIGGLQADGTKVCFRYVYLDCW